MESVASTSNSLRKYRAPSYDKYDEMYANRLKHYVIPDSFHVFTDYLMEESHINRFKLLDAIADYKASDVCKQFPLLINFEDTAFNYRPYQPGCIIS
jgi:hypothetical protein